jgi:hypothetical protein
VKLALNVYNDYLFILTEKERVEESLKKITLIEINSKTKSINIKQKLIRLEKRCLMKLELTFLIKCSDINK